MILALQYWQGDSQKAFRLARILASFESEFRGDVMLALVSSFDYKVEKDLEDTIKYCSAKFLTASFRSALPGQGHPNGSNQLWLGTMEILGELWRKNKLAWPRIFTFEPDSIPLSKNWIYELMIEHSLVRYVGKQITGALMPVKHPSPTICEGCIINDVPTKLPAKKTFTKMAPFCPGCHVNGNLIMNLPFWVDRKDDLGKIPSNVAWDVHAAPVLLPQTRPTKRIVNVVGSAEWSTAEFSKARKEGGSWVHGIKSDKSFEEGLKFLREHAETNP